MRATAARASRCAPTSSRPPSSRATRTGMPMRRALVRRVEDACGEAVAFRHRRDPHRRCAAGRPDRRQHVHAGIRLAARLDPGVAGRDLARDRAQQRAGRVQPASASSGGAARPTIAPAVAAAGRARRQRGQLHAARNGRRDRRTPRRVPHRLSGRGVAERYRSLVERVDAGRTGARACPTGCRARSRFTTSSCWRSRTNGRWRDSHGAPDFRRELEATFEGDFRLRFHLGAWPFARTDPATGRRS